MNYLIFLKKAQEIMETCERNNEKNSADYGFAKNIYKEAFAGLIEAGYPCKKEGDSFIIVIEDKEYVLFDHEGNRHAMPETKREQEIEKIEIKEEEEIIDVEEDIEEELVDIEEVEEEQENEEFAAIEDMEMEEPETDMGFIEEPEFPEDDMLELGPDAFDIEPEDEYEPEEIEIEQDDDVAQHEDEISEPEQEEKQPPVEEKKESPLSEEIPENNNAQKDEVSDIVEQMTRDTKMPGDMHKSDFTFVYDMICIRNSNTDEEYNMKTIVYPFVLDESNPAIIACINTGDGQDVVLCDKKGVIKYYAGECPFTIKGKFENGNFSVDYSVFRGFESEGYEIELTKRRSFGNEGHMLLTDESAIVHIMPLSFKNNAQTVADFMYYINVDNKEKFGSSVDGPVTFKFQGTEMEIIAKWSTDDNRLYCNVVQL